MMATDPNPNLEGYSFLYKHIAHTPELGLFRRFGAFWAKKLHDDTSEFLACLSTLNEHLGKISELDGKTVLDCPLHVVKQVCPMSDSDSKPLYEAWAAYDMALLQYGMFVRCVGDEVKLTFLFR
jgi:hypothetical protein